MPLEQKTCRRNPLLIRRVCDFFIGMTVFLGTHITYQNMNCHPDRSVAQWWDLLCLNQYQRLMEAPPNLCHPESL